MQAPALDIKQAHTPIQLKHDSPLVTCRFEPKGRFAFSTAEDNKIQRWELPGGKLTALAAHDSWVWCLGTTADGETLLSGGGDGKLIWWPVAGDAPAPARTVEAHSGWVRCLAISPNGQLVATGGNDKLVRVWNLADGAKKHEFAGHDVPVYSVLWHPNGESLLSGDLRGNVKQWELAKNAEVRKFDAKALHSYNGGQQVDFGGVRGMALSPDGKHLACAGLHKGENPLGAVLEPLVMLFEWESQKLVQSHVADGGLKGPLWRVQYLADGTLMGVMGGSGGGFLLFWKADQAKETHRFKLPALARDMDLHPDGLQVATAHSDRHLRISKLAAKVG